MEQNQITAKQPAFVKWAIMLAIVVTLNIFTFVAVDTLYPEPLLEDYCDVSRTPALDSLSCSQQKGVWVTTPAVDVAGKEAQPQATNGYCDVYATCQPHYDGARLSHDQILYLVLVIVAVSALVLGIMPLGAAIVSTGLSYGGVLMLVIASIRFWDVAGKFGQLAIAAFAFGIVLYIGIRKFRDT